MKSLSTFLLVSLLLWISCSSPTSSDGRLGKVSLTVTGAKAAQPYFHKGLLLLHSFEYEDASAAFQQAREIDPDFVMAYWGEAMTHNHPLWQQQDYDKATAVLNSLNPSPEGRTLKAKTEMERDFLRAVEVLYGQGEKPERDQAYAEFMKGLYQKYPGNHEIASFYALSLLGSIPDGRDVATYEKGAVIAKGILKENANHPGALHYLIHSYDDPDHAALAIKAANSYSKVAPDAAHALHMPSHIYVALGMWDEVIASNEASWQASVDRMTRMNLDYSSQTYHGFHWLLYGVLQKGDHERARKIMEDMQFYTDSVPSKGARAYLIDMKGTYLVETGDWESPVADIEADREDLNIVHRAIYTFLEGMKAYKKGDTATLRLVIDAMASERESESLRLINREIPVCGGAGFISGLPNQSDLKQAQVMELELSGLYAWAAGDTAAADAKLAEATTLETESDYSYGPPRIVYPSFELYGKWLLEVGRPEAALAQFEKALERGPGRLLALGGEMAAAEGIRELGN